MESARQSVDKSRVRPAQHPVDRALGIVQRRTPVNHELLQRKADRCVCGGSCPRCRAGSDLKTGASDGTYQRQSDGNGESAPASPGQAPAPAGLAPPKVKKKTVTIQPVAVANDDGKSPTAIPSFADAKTIWGKCCVDLTVNAAKQVDKTAFKELKAPADCAPKKEAKALADAAKISGSVISVFVPDTFKDGGTAGKDVHGGGFATHAGTTNPKVFIVSGAHGTVVAHELGHAMGHASCLGKSGHQPAGTVMEPSGAHDRPVLTKVAAEICTNVRGFTGATGSGKTDCAQDLT